LLWALYRYRLHQITREFEVRLEERVNERTRIARDLHDTLLQSFHGLMFRIQAARNMLPRRPDEAGQSLDGVIAAAEQAIDEGRSAIQALRSQAADQVDITESLTVMGRNWRILRKWRPIGRLSTSPWKGNGTRCRRSSRTKSIESRAKYCGMPSSTHMQLESKPR
jgi:hypothetical protein